MLIYIEKRLGIVKKEKPNKLCVKYEILKLFTTHCVFVVIICFQRARTASGE